MGHSLNQEFYAKVHLNRNQILFLLDCQLFDLCIEPPYSIYVITYIIYFFKYKQICFTSQEGNSNTSVKVHSSLLGPNINSEFKDTFSSMNMFVFLAVSVTDSKYIFYDNNKDYEIRSRLL